MGQDVSARLARVRPRRRSSTSAAGTSAFRVAISEPLTRPMIPGGPVRPTVEVIDRRENLAQRTKIIFYSSHRPPNNPQYVARYNAAYPPERVEIAKLYRAGADMKDLAG